MAFAPAVVILAAWELIAQQYKQVSFFFSSPLSIWHSLWQHTVDGVLPIDLLYTAIPTLIGFILSVTIGTCIGLLLAASNQHSLTLRAYISFFANLPIFAIAPMMIVWFGIGLSMKFALALFSSIFVATLQSYDGAMTITSRQREVLVDLGASRTQVIRYLLLPGSIAWIVSGMRVTASLALLGTFVGEFMASEHGLGHQMLRAGSLYDVGYVLACAIYMVGLVLLMNWLSTILDHSKLKVIEVITVHPSVWSRR